MQFLLANPTWLWLLALGVVPLLVHLFARTNPQKYHFSNTEFLHRLLKKTTRLRKPQDWLILALRTLAIIALLFAFLQPILTNQNNLPTSKKTTLFLIDRSASMAAKDGNTDRFTLACQKVTELLKTGTTDEANIIWIDSQPNSAFPQPGPNLDYLRELVTRTEVSRESGAIASAIQTATAQLEQIKGRRELVIISDFQATAWEDFKIETPQGIEVAKVRVGNPDTSIENLALQTLYTNPTVPILGQDVTIIARIKNHSATPSRSTLYLDINGGRQSRDINIPAWGETETNFQTRFTSPGLVPITAKIAGDPFPLDDTRHSVIEVRDTLEFISITTPNNPEAATLARLASALPWLNHRISDAPPAPGSADYLFYHQASELSESEIQKHLSAGTTIFLKPALGLTGRTLNTHFQTELNPVAFAPQKNDEGWKVNISTQADPDAPTFALFKTGEYGSPAAGIFKTRFNLPPLPNTTSLLDYQDSQNTPALLAHSTKPLYLWNLPLDPTQTTWPAQTTFVPFLAELLLNSRNNSTNNSLELLPGGPLSWTPREGISPESLTLIDQEKNTLPTEINMTQNGPRLTADQAAAPGLYRWMLSNDIAHQQAVNFPNTESDLRQTDPNAIAGGEVIDATKLSRRAALGDGIPFWPWCLGIAITALIAEALLTLWKPKATTAQPA